MPASGEEAFHTRARRGNPVMIGKIGYPPSTLPVIFLLFFGEHLGDFGALGAFGIAPNLGSPTAIYSAGEPCATMLLSEINRASV